MKYDDPALKEFSGYFEAKEPGRRERADAWATAIGLQKVDGLSTSRFLVATAKDHIEGKISQSQARRRIREYYAAKCECAKPDSSLEEPDKVSERMVAVINDRGFEFTPEYYLSVHRRLFSGILPSAGKVRTVNVAKREWVLKDDSVTYGSKDSLMQSLARDFRDERDQTAKAQTAKSTQKSTQKSAQKILVLLAQNPTMTRNELSVRVGITPDGVKKALQKLKTADRIRRIGPDRGGRWEVVGGADS